MWIDHTTNEKDWFGVLQLGAMGEALAALPKPLPEDDGYARAKARAMLRAYARHWDWSEYEILKVEHEFCFPLVNPDTETPSRTFDEAGKIDLIARHRPSDRVLVIEHKTTSDRLTPDSDYWDRLRMDTQCSKYFLAAMNATHIPSGILYDVLSKPGQRPCFVPDVDADGFKICLDATGKRMMTKDGKKPRETADAAQGWTLQGHTETPAEYESRLDKVLAEAPGDYLAQREIPRLNSDLIEYMQDAWAVSQQILYARNKNLWPRNPGACAQFGTCEYFDLCCGRASVDGISYRQSDRIHAELKTDKQGRNLELLTNSRLSALRRCPRFHKLRYEDGIGRVKVDEALAFGSLVHAGLEGFFTNLMQTTKQNTTT